MRKIIVFFISSILVLNSFTTTALAASILSKTKIHEITSCESVLNSSFEAYIECLNDQVFSSKHFLKLSKNKKNDIQSLLAIANILSENIEDEFLSKPKAVSIWNKIINYPYKGKIKKKKLQKVLEQTTCQNKKEFESFIKCFSEEFRNFEVYQKSDLLNKRRMETIVSNALFLTKPGSEVYAVAKIEYQRGKTYGSSDGFDYFFTYMNMLGTDYFKKVKSNVEWKKIITFIVIAIIVAILAKGLLKSFSKGSYSSPSGASASSSSGLTSQQAASSAGVKFQSMGMKNMFRYAPSNSVMHTKWFKYGFVKGFW